jgi:hypothetical protein
MCYYINPQDYLHDYIYLRVTEVAEGDYATYDELRNVVDEWARIAEDFEARSEDAKTFFHDLKFTAAGIKTNLYFSSYQILICKDYRYKDIQALGKVKLCDNHDIQIMWLVTNPHNIRCKLNEKAAHKTRGAASAIIYYLATHLPLFCSKIVVTSLVSSIAFYEKLGFEKEQCSDMTLRMYLTTSKIKRLLKVA